MLLNTSQPGSGENANTRSVVTFYHEMLDKQDGISSTQEVDLLDYEVLVESYKFLAKNLQTSRQRQRSVRTLRKQNNENEPPHSSNDNEKYSVDILTDLHKQAILTLVEIDKDTKRVVRILPEFFPPNTRILPACLVKLDALESLPLQHCRELTCLPEGFSFPQLKELRIDVSSFREQLPKAIGSLTNVEILVLGGHAAVLDTSPILFPSSLARMGNLKHLETHIRNLLQFPAEVMDVWSNSVEILVTTQDLLCTNNSEIQHRGHFISRSRSFSTNDSSDDDFDYISSDDEEISDDGFSLLPQDGRIRKALETQLEVRAFTAISEFRNLRSLKLHFDDSKHHSSIGNKGVGNSYCIPLSLLGGPLSSSLRELYIGTCTTSTKPKRSRIPIQIAWDDILQEFPMLKTLCLEDCRASFSNKTQILDDETVLYMPELRHLVLERCPEFALVDHGRTTIEKFQQITSPSIIDEEDGHEYIISPSLSVKGDIEVVGENNTINLDDESEEIIFCPLPNDSIDFDDDTTSSDGGKAAYFQPLNDADVDIMLEEHPEEISRIIRLSGLLAEKLHEDAAEANQLSNLCRYFIPYCPNLEKLCLRDCKIPEIDPDLSECLPKSSFRDLTLDVDETNKDILMELFETHPHLVRIQGTCVDNLSTLGYDELSFRLNKNQMLREETDNFPLPWTPFWDHNKKKPQGKDNETNKNEGVSRESTNDLFDFLARAIFSFDHTRRQRSQATGRRAVLQTIQRSNSRDVI